MKDYKNYGLRQDEQVEFSAQLIAACLLGLLFFSLIAFAGLF